MDHYSSISEPDREFIDRALGIWQISALQGYFRQMTLDATQSMDVTINSLEMDDTGNQSVQTSSQGRRIHSDNPFNHFMRCFDRIMSQGYHPKLEDILNLRLPTSGRHFQLREISIEYFIEYDKIRHLY